MVTRRVRTPRGENPPEYPGIMTKPLPQILDEMEANIKAAVEAARKAEEAAKYVSENYVDAILQEKIKYAIKYISSQ